MTADCIVGPLSLIFSSFMSVGKIPSEWSHLIVTRVHKGGSAASVSNFRPISGTCVTNKIMELVIAHDMLIYLRHHNVISKQQHGFLSGRSTTNNLLDTLNDWTLGWPLFFNFQFLLVRPSKNYPFDEKIHHIKFYDHILLFRGSSFTPISRSRSHDTAKRFTPN